MAQLFWMIVLISVENFAGTEAQDDVGGGWGGGTTLPPESVSVLLLHAIIVIMIIAITIICLRPAFIFALFKSINKLIVAWFNRGSIH